MATIILTLLVFWSGFVTTVSSAPRPNPVSFRLNTTAENVFFTNPPDPKNETAILAWGNGGFASPSARNGTSTVRGVITLNGIYCQPNVTAKNAIQILVHGGTYNKTYWTGFDLGEEYDWNAVANGQGYHTLAIDRLCHGVNLPPLDPLSVVQFSLQVELMHALVTSIRGQPDPGCISSRLALQKRACNGLPRSFNKVAYVGHSVGSMLGTGFAQAYPNDTNALVLTGFSSTLGRGGGSSAGFKSAASVWPTRYGSLPLGYLTSATEESRETFYAGSYDPAVARIDFQYEDTVTIGELSTIGDGFRPATNFTAPTMIVNGDKDSLFCSSNINKTCDQILKDTKVFYPNVVNFEGFAVPNTGHDINLHHSAPVAAQKINDFFNKYL